MRLLVTKLHRPWVPPKRVLRPQLIERLNEGLQRTSGVILVSAPAGFGKTTLVSEWVANCDRPFAWLSLDEGDNSAARFLAYLIAALQTLSLSGVEGIAADIGKEVAGVLQAPQPPIESVLTILLNELTTLPDHFVLVLDDYDVIEAKPVNLALSYLLEHLPPQMHLVITTREDPDLPLARLRALGRLTELRASDLRFTSAEAADFLNPVMGLQLSAENITALESRTEGWIAGLQLAAISLQGQKDATRFIQSFTGSHHFVLDYLLEEVLHQQSERLQTFLLCTSILDRLCGPLCDAILLDPSRTRSGQETLEYIERANLFIVPLDYERRWYRYHQLFADLLRQRLQQSFTSPSGDAESSVNELHRRASQWYEENDLQYEAFHHAAAAHDMERAERLIEGKGMLLRFRGAVTIILDWLESLPATVLNARPSLWWRYASLLLVTGQMSGVEEKLQAAEAALGGTEVNDKTRILVGRIAAVRAVLALNRYQVETMLAQSQRALEYLPASNLSLRANVNWTLGYAYLLQGDRAAARQALTEAITLSQASDDIFTTLLATISLGNLQEAENQLYLAAETYRRVLQLAGDQPLQITYEAHLGLARVLYEWNDLDVAEQHGRQSIELARQYERVTDRFVICEVFLARLKLAQGDVPGAAAIMAQVDQYTHQQNSVTRIPDVAAIQVLTLLRQGNLAAAAHLAETHELPISRARVHLAQKDPSSALAVLEPWRRQVEAKGWQDERLKVMLLQAVAHYAHDENDKAVQVLGDALALAEPGGFIRLFVDEGVPMAHLLSEAATRGMMPAYIGKLLAALKAETQSVLADHQASPVKSADNSALPPDQPLVEPLSERELEVLQLIAQGLSNGEICERLHLALDTIKGHNRRIFSKLHVQRRTEAVARARELGLIQV